MIDILDPATLIFGPIFLYLIFFWLKGYTDFLGEKRANYKLNKTSISVIMFGVACFFVVRLAWNIGMESSSRFVQILSSIIVGSAGIGLIGFIWITISGQGWNE